MALMCRQIIGSWASCAGWVGLIVATATNDWVRTCDYTLATCVRLDELVAKGLWAECVISPALYHCAARDQILALPGTLKHLITFISNRCFSSDLAEKARSDV